MSWSARLALPLAAPVLLLAACAAHVVRADAGGTGGGPPNLAINCIASAPSDTSGDVCAVEFTCSPDAQHFEILCAQSGPNFECTCSSGTAGTSAPFGVSRFKCDAFGAVAVISGACDFGVQLQLAQ
jgi:hypothetical protein